MINTNQQYIVSQVNGPRAMNCNPASVMGSAFLLDDVTRYWILS